MLFVPLPRSQRNDDIDDTAQQAQANFNCYPRGAALPSTCPGKPTNQPKFDPVNNYMGYSECRTMQETHPGASP